MTPGYAKTREELPWLPYRTGDEVLTVNAHNFPSGGIWTPAEISTALWLDAADANTLYDATSGGSLVAANGAVARWEDKSGNGRHATQSTSSRRPTRLAALLNGLDALSFDGGDLMESPDWYTSDITVFCVARKPNTAEQRFIAKFNGTGNQREWLFDATNTQRIVKNAVGNLGSENQLVTGGVIGSDFNVLGFIKSGTSAVLSLNGNLTTGTFGSETVFNGNLAWTIGADLSGGGGFFLNGNIGELVLVANGSDSDARQSLEGYLAHKWGLTSGLPSDHPYKSTAP